jgi:hypothetical protein
MIVAEMDWIGAVGDRPHETVVKSLFARYSRMVDFSVAVAL